MIPVGGRSEEGPAAPIVFPNYMQMRRRVPIGVWRRLRVLSVLGFLSLCVTLLVRPAGGLFIFWHVLVPCLPLLFFVGPGLWRNLCPLAAVNQAPRVLGFSRARSSPRWLRERGYVVAVALFLAIVPARLVLFDRNGAALAALLFGLMLAAFTGGVLLKGKSGWCSTICPLFPVQRLYGQTPFVTIPNSHCQPCVGCSKNCYDFNPGVAYQADLYDADPRWSAARKLFAGAFPGLIVAFFTLPVPPAIPTPELYLRFAAYLLVSAGSFFALTSLLPVSVSKLAALYAAAALNIFYWYGSRRIAASVGTITGTEAEWLVWPLRAVVLVLSLAWFVRTVRTERNFLDQSLATEPVRLAVGNAPLLTQPPVGDGAEVVVLPDERRIVAARGATLLEVIERDGLPIEAGCRMGMCGSDPVAILDGAANLAPITDDEATTLRRLGLASNTRMACSARLTGDVCVSLTPETPEKAGAGFEPIPVDFDRSIGSVVIVGNGIAGVTAADFVRRNHPECAIHLVGREAHPLYNRMGISRLIYGRSAMQGLYLLPESWYDEHGITAWLNTRPRRLDLDSRQVVLATGEELAFDRLVLATGSSSFVPPVQGFGLPGSFVLREAADAISIRAYAQEWGVSHAVVAGGGLLGLESAYALRQLGMDVTVLERSGRLLRKQVDERCSELLSTYLEGHGIDVLPASELAQVEGSGRVEAVVLSTGATLSCGVVLVCAGIRPNVELAREAGIAVKRGVLVDDHMRTSEPGVYAAGDVAEHEGQVLGLWPVAVSQAEVAAVNAMGGDRSHPPVLPPTILKGVGIDLTSVGRVDPSAGDETIVVENAKEYSYGRLLVTEGRIVGAILLNRPLDVPAVLGALRGGTDIGERLEQLRQGRWDVLQLSPVAASLR